MGMRVFGIAGLVVAAAVTGAVVGGNVTAAVGAPIADDTVASPPEATVVAEAAADAEGIIFMLEEEKLARDVYLALGDLWGLRIFSNIAAAEQRHLDAMLDLARERGLAGDVPTAAIGSFDNADLQELHDDLVDFGSRSLEDALEVGAIIEEVDINDLETYLAATEADDVATVYENLLRGSRNHLRAFVSQLAAAGVERQPYEMDAAAYEEVLASEVERGGGQSLGDGDSRGQSLDVRSGSGDGIRGPRSGAQNEWSGGDAPRGRGGQGRWTQ